ncbi:MAG: ion transporter [Lachnospiraceae bacterium]|nr:ion transporter [Lachnospiraceae bacterium]
MEKARKRTFEIIQIGNRPDIPSILFDFFITGVIFLNLFITFFSTYEEYAPYAKYFDPLEIFTLVVFTVEYALRLWTAKYLYPAEDSSLHAAVLFIFSFYGMIDLLTIIPYYIPGLINGAIAFRVLRVFRIFRLFKINAQYDAFNVISDVLKEKKEQLISSVCLIMILMLASSLCMYSLEHDAQPENFKNAFSGIWWSMSTLLTVGYGDIYPITIGGRIMAIIIAFLGVGIVAIPTGIISAGFVGQVQKISSSTAQSGRTDNITILINREHPWLGKTSDDLCLPPELVPVSVTRQNKELPLDHGLRFIHGDRVIIHVIGQK